MPVITFGKQRDQIWGGAGWALRQALKDLRRYAGGDQAFLDALQTAERVGNFGVDMLHPALRGRVLSALKQMCRDIADGTNPSSIGESLPGDQVASDNYHEALRQLLSMVEAAERHP